MSKLQMKRFESMKSSGQTIIDKTNARIHANTMQSRSTSAFYYIGLAVVTCIVSFGLYSLLSKDTIPAEQATPTIQNEPVIKDKEKVIEMNEVADGQILIRGEKFYFQADDYTIKNTPILNNYIRADEAVLIDEQYYDEIKEAFRPQIKENAVINASIAIQKLRQLKEGAYKIEQLALIVHDGLNQHTLFTINFAEEGKTVVLPEELLARYEAFKESYNRQTLRGLSPIDVFYLYEYAFDQQDYETRYELIMPDEPYYKPEKEEYLNELIDYANVPYIHPFYKQELYLSVFKSNGVLQANIITSMNDKEYAQFFELTQSIDGIWFVNFLPMQ